MICFDGGPLDLSFGRNVFFNLEIKSDTSVQFSSAGVGGASQDVPPPPAASPCLSILYLCFCSLFCNFVRSCLNQHDSIFNWELLGGPVRRPAPSLGRLAGNEGPLHCARCFSAPHFTLPLSHSTCPLTFVYLFFT